jgi:hypothetical protein
LIKHLLGGFDGIRFGVFICEIDDLFDARLDDEFGAFVAGK